MDSRYTVYMYHDKATIPIHLNNNHYIEIVKKKLAK